MHDTVVEANKPCTSILIIGKALCGRTSVCKALKQQLDIEHIEITPILEELFTREPKDPDIDPETGEEIPVETFTPLEQEVRECLLSGKALSEEMLLKIYKEQIDSDKC